MTLLETRDLTKQFGGLTALDRVDFGIERGELVSLIGPNGAGKSTLINTITGLLEPTEGEVYYAGNEAFEGEIPVELTVDDEVVDSTTLGVIDAGDAEKVTLTARAPGLPDETDWDVTVAGQEVDGDWVAVDHGVPDEAELRATVDASGKTAADDGFEVTVTVRNVGNDLVGMKPFEIAQLGIGRSFQTASIFPELTVRENVEIAAYAAEHGSFTVNFFRHRGSFDEVHRRTNDILETLRIDENEDLLAKSLPYGEKRRLEVAIGLTTGPDLMFMDEPTAGMTPAETEMTVSLIRELLEDWGMTILLVEHDMDVVFDVSDRILTLHQGELIAEGTPEEIRNDPIVREAYLGGEAP